MVTHSVEYDTAIRLPCRQFDVGGTAVKNDGTTLALTRANVMEFQVESQMVSTYNKFDIGAVCAATLTMSIIDSSSADSYAGARITPTCGLKLADNSFEYIPMGVFYLDNTTLERVKDRIKFKAYDGMILLDFEITDTYRATLSHLPVYTMLTRICTLAGLTLKNTHDEIEALPNGTLVCTAQAKQIESGRDVVMWIAQMTGCFARMSRDNKLELVQIKAETDELNMIIPVREILANVRYKTTFADDTTRPTRLIMKVDGVKKGAKMTNATVRANGFTLELEENPILKSSGVSIGSALVNLLEVLYTARFRPFNSKIANDPSLESGDYVRLRGGSIDTERGYATGIITHNKWVYCGAQDIKSVGELPPITTVAASELVDGDNIVQSNGSVLLMSTSSDTGNCSEDDFTEDELIYTRPRAQENKASENKEITTPYTTAIEFTATGFNLTFAQGSTTATNTFTVTEDAQGRITAINNTTAERTIEVTYND